ncbi:SMP-30/gluconolactonase/LRE family protein [Stenotrophomonas aracearum]|jgi:DNA-binding IclR family transcriptional regulator/sugar lactone lactonase YvrE|uniref:SMP-30/gluconolactonase/LRE family protein n=1 Tax=Stenotrophomonas aracearum TaxID=3003272 RepID=A0ABY9Y937_9GAMM|nr:SMP-30/gluconolactonase/LRE family protein [Stenotrophomonas sp. A5588]WNH47381.1 SMP-30/gluconolactonase/LRE family protein [Stenotrophomonas sp. A5588]
MARTRHSASRDDLAEVVDDGDPRFAIPGAQALSKGLSLLTLIADAPHPLPFSELGRYSGLPKSTLHRILQTLIEYRLVRVDEASQTYRLGTRLFEMAHQVWSDFDLRSAAEPELLRLRELAQETTRLGILEGRDILIIDQRDHVQAMRLANGVGSRMPAVVTSIGKAMMSHRPPEELQRYLSSGPLTALTPHSILDLAELQREMDLIKARGYAVSVEESALGVSGVAAPILDHRGEAIGAVSISGPSFRLPLERLHALGRDVIEAARRIAGNVGETFMSISTSVTPSHAVDHDVRCVIPHSAFLAESPHWLGDGRSLLWVDILAPSVNISNLVTGDTRTTPLGELVGVVVPRTSGGFIAATQSGFRVLDLPGGDMHPIAAPLHMSGRRFNDGKCDALGRLWAGTLAIDATPERGALYRLDTDGVLDEIEGGFHICNGLGWSPDNTRFYLADSGRRTVYVYDYALDTGRVSNKRVFATFTDSEGMPDGLAVDAQGHVWCAMWDGWAIKRLAPDGTVVRSIDLPVPRPTNLAFGGPQLKTLYITTARIRLSATQLAAAPLSGSLLALDVDVAGAPVRGYGG